MEKSKNRIQPIPVPIIDREQCDGCGLCIKVCPKGALAIRDGVAIVAHPLRCDYHGFCEAACPKQAIQRPFEVIFSASEKKGES